MFDVVVFINVSMLILNELSKLIFEIVKREDNKNNDKIKINTAKKYL